jgi:hypothetical protein
MSPGYAELIDSAYFQATVKPYGLPVGLALIGLTFEFLTGNSRWILQLTGLLLMVTGTKNRVCFPPQCEYRQGYGVSGQVLRI